MDNEFKAEPIGDAKSCTCQKGLASNREVLRKLLSFPL